MPSYKTYTTEQYTKFLKNSTSNNFGLSDDKLADWFMAQAGAVPVINSYGVTKENLLSTYIPKIKEYQGEAAFFLFYTVTEGGGAGNWINHYQNDTSSTGLGCLIDDLEYCKSIDDNYPGYPVAMTAQEVAGTPPQENINQAQQVYRECGKGTIGSIIMPSTMAGNAWVFAENWCLENQGSRPPAVYFGNPYDLMINTIKGSGADPFGGGSGGGGGGSIDEGLPGNNAPTQTTPTVDTSELMTAFEALTNVVKQQIEKLKDVSDSNVYPLSLNKMYQANKYYKLTKMMNLTRVTLSREILDDIIKTIQDAVKNAENSAENLQPSNKNENVDTNPPEPPSGGGSGETSELDNYINKSIAHMKDLQTRGFTYSMDARWGATSRDCSSAVCESYNLGNGNTVTMDSTQLPNHGFEKVVENPYMADGWSAQRGDVFILYPNGSSPAASAGAAGHTGIFIDNVNIIHMNYASNGVSIDHCANVFSSYYGLNVWRPTRAN